MLEVTNHSRGDIRFIVDVQIAYEENIDAAIEVIKKTSTLFEEKHQDKLRSEIDVLGVLSLNASGVTEEGELLPYFLDIPLATR